MAQEKHLLLHLVSCSILPLGRPLLLFFVNGYYYVPIINNEYRACRWLHFKLDLAFLASFASCKGLAWKHDPFSLSPKFRFLFFLSALGAAEVASCCRAEDEMDHPINITKKRLLGIALLLCPLLRTSLCLRVWACMAVWPCAVLHRL